MTLCGIWVKADNGRWFDEPTIGGPDWELELSEFSADYLHVRAVKNPQPNAPKWIAKYTAASVIEHNKLPLECYEIGSKSGHYRLERTICYRVKRHTGAPFPRGVILDKCEGRLRRGKQGTFIGGE